MGPAREQPAAHLWHAPAMLDPWLTEALDRLDTWLVRVCDLEERRAQLLAGDGAGGWVGVRNLLAPTAGELTWATPAEEPQLLPAGAHPLRRIAGALSLEDCETHALLVLLAPHLEPRYGALYAVLNDDLQAPRATARTLLAVLGRTPRARRVLLASLGQGGRLRRGGLVQGPGEGSAPLKEPLDLAADLVEALQVPAPPRDDPPADELPTFLVVHGHGDRTAAARARAAHPVAGVRLNVSLPSAAEDLDVAWRRALHADALQLLELVGDEPRDVDRIARRAHELVSELGGRIWLSTTVPTGLPVPHLLAGGTTWPARRAWWLAAAEAAGLSLDREAAGRLATRHRLSEEGVRATVDSALADPRALDGAEAVEDLFERAAQTIAHRGLRHGRLRATTRTFDDLVVRRTTRAALERLVFFVEHRDRINEARGLDHRYRLEQGPLVLFSGRSGTGKTLAAEIVAGALGRPMQVVDLASLVSKYIGETEKNIDEVLREGEATGAVLFFDEADSLFSTRTEVSSSNDRYANLEVGYLLQRIEHHDGLVILATNLRQSIDEAFLRRLQFRIEFPMPEASEREQIWSLMVPEGVPTAGPLDFSALSRHRLAGGHIRNAALKAIFLAEQQGQPLTQGHLDEGVRIELLELGRLSRPEGSPLDRGLVVREVGEALHGAMEAVLRERFLKEVHIVQGSPTRQALAGKRPAVSLVMYRISARRADGGVRLGFIVSAFSDRPEEENELLGVVHQCLGSFEPERVAGLPVRVRIQESYDFDLVHRFWSSHEQPVRASVVVDVEVGGAG